MGADFDDAEEEVGDDRLRLIFIACHPVLSREARVALTLRLVAGLTTEEIARAYLVREATVAQRVVRAKRSLSEARVPFELPPANQLEERLERSSRSFTWCSTRATRRPLAAVGEARALPRGAPARPHYRRAAAG